MKIDNNRSSRLILMSLLLWPSFAFGAKPKPLSQWHKRGKAAHARAAGRKGKALDRYCTGACRKAGAKRPENFGACKESCVFG